MIKKDLIELLETTEFHIADGNFELYKDDVELPENLYLFTLPTTVDSKFKLIPFYMTPNAFEKFIKNCRIYENNKKHN